MARSAPTPARDTRREILDAALDLFAEHGFAGTSMRALARAVGLRESALYHHFPSKDAIFQGLVEEVVEARISFLTVDVAPFLQRPLRELLLGMSQLIARRMRSPRERKFARLFLSEGTRVFGGLGPQRALFLRPKAAFVKLVKDLQKQKKIRADLEPELLMTHLIAPLAIALVTELLVGKSLVDLSIGKFVEAHVDFILRAVEP